MAEYNLARQNRGRKRELLNRLRETVLQNSAVEQTLENLPPRDPWLSIRSYVLAGADSSEDRELIDNAAPPPPSPEEPKLETRTFQVPADFLERRNAAGAELWIRPRSIRFLKNCRGGRAL